MDSVLKNILSQYDKKKTQAEVDAKTRKEELYQKYPKLQNIDDKVSSLAISTTKSIIANNDKNLLKELNDNINKLKEEKYSILKKLNIPEDYFEPHYECPICKDTGYVTNNDYSVTMCSCLKQKLYNEQYNKSNISNLDTQNFNNFSDLLYSDKVDKKYNADSRMRTVAFTKKVELYMAAADVILTKPGGLSSTEAAVVNIPLVHVNAIPGCETCNAHFFSEHGMSLWAKNNYEAVRFAQLLTEDTTRSEKMRAAQRKYIYPDAAQTIVQEICGK